MTQVFEEQLDKYGSFAYTTKGVSMMPLLRQGRDVVTIVKKTGRLKPMDVALYRRNGQYVLHRVIRVTDDGYLIRGDNTYVMENIKEQQVIGVMDAIARKGRRIKCSDWSYRVYSRLWNATFLVRHLAVGTKRKLRRLL